LNTVGDFAFDADSRVSPAGADGEFTAVLTGRWNGTGGRRPDADLRSLPLLVDSTAPSVLELGVTSTTIQLTVHLRAHPAPGWLACRATTRFVSGGYHEEDFEVWDSTGTLVAQSRQLALILPL
jgi:Thioesterase-like superfamily